jgi:hypothetical protein
LIKVLQRTSSSKNFSHKINNIETNINTQNRNKIRINSKGEKADSMIPVIPSDSTWSHWFHEVDGITDSEAFWPIRSQWSHSESVESLGVTQSQLESFENQSESLENLSDSDWFSNDSNWLWVTPSDSTDSKWFHWLHFDFNASKSAFFPLINGENIRNRIYCQKLMNIIQDTFKQGF